MTPSLSLHSFIHIHKVSLSFAHVNCRLHVLSLYLFYSIALASHEMAPLSYPHRRELEKRLGEKRNKNWVENWPLFKKKIFSSVWKRILSLSLSLSLSFTSCPFLSFSVQRYLRRTGWMSTCLPTSLSWQAKPFVKCSTRYFVHAAKLSADTLACPCSLSL